MAETPVGCGGFVKTKSLVLIVVICSAFSFSSLPSVTSAEASHNPQCFVYELGNASGYTSLGDFKEKNEYVGTLTAYDSGGVLHIGIYIYAKPYFAWGEKDKDGNGTVEPSELRSDGIKLSVFGAIYEWWVDEDKPHDPAFQVSSYPDGINSEPIMYFLNLEVPGGYDVGDTVEICVEKVHVSPKEFVDPTPPYPIPEVPIGTVLLLITSFAVYFLLKADKDYMGNLVSKNSSPLCDITD